jgi:autotransporter-associated beta strand protein
VVDARSNATINAPITGSADLIKIGRGNSHPIGCQHLLRTHHDQRRGATHFTGREPRRAPWDTIGQPVDLQWGTLQATAGFALNANRGITLNAGGGTFDVTGANVLTYGGVIALADELSAANLTKVGTGTLTLSGNNTYSGATAINAGVLSISQDANLGVPPGTPLANQLTFNGGTLEATGRFALNANRGIMLNAGGGTFDVPSFPDVDGSVLTYGGVIAAPAI